MKYLLLMVLCLSLSKSNFAQQKNPETNSFEYYIELKGNNTKKAIKEFDIQIRGKSEVVNFNGYGFPRFFYILRTKTPITNELFKSWLLNLNYQVIKFTPGIISQNFITAKKNNPKIQFADFNKKDKL
jgi:hypothetical protein